MYKTHSITKQPLISVIIPVWNPGPGIDRCINSLRSQSLKNIEMIFVVESIALVIAIIGIATNNYKRMFFGFGGYYMYAVCGIIIQMLSAGQIMETIDKVRLFVNFVIWKGLKGGKGGKKGRKGTIALAARGGDGPRCWPEQ